jgi:hypothetical protein
MRAFPTLILTSLFMALCSLDSTNHKNDLQGAWQFDGPEASQVVIFADGYFTHTSYNVPNKRFVKTRGGAYTFTGGILTVRFEFNSKDSMQIGKSIKYKAKVGEDELTTDLFGEELVCQRIDEGSTGLYGLWQITGRQQAGKMQQIHQTGTRKTIKILSATRFQWAAIDPGTKHFMGTGGVTYTFENGKYTENIEFFSRDSSRIGQSLRFDGKLEGGAWHHSGQSSKGDPIYEVWERKKKL